MKALVVYHTKNGVTKRMAEEIANHLSSNNAEVQVGSIYDVSSKFHT
jgi:menaquinone-dependent protoporphyrinogen IX oxidase